MMRNIHTNLLLFVGGLVLTGGHLLAGPRWQEVPPDSLAVQAARDTLPYRIPGPSGLNIPHDTTEGQVLSTLVPDSRPNIPLRTDLLGPDFTRTGSISRGFLVGSNRDASVVSGFRLQFAGPLTDAIRVQAALTDENSPIQPEGTTQSLREVDKVSIDLLGPSFGLTLGDFFFERRATQAGEFGQLSRKVQGIQGHVEGDLPGADGIQTYAKVVGASSRAEYHTLLLQGIEGVQGPYRLSGKNNEQYIVVVAGSERVSINGEQLVRGETQDYVIDYATGEVTFTTRRMITSESRIYVDFEYADRNYARNLLGAEVQTGLSNDALSVRFSVLQEADDPDNPAGGPLDQMTLSLLRSSGADRWAASRSGIVEVGGDTVSGRGKGQYALRDTTLSGTSYVVLVYAPGDPDALYAATFSRVTAVPPDSLGYRRVRGGEYSLAGLGQGTHVPRIFVEAPKMQRSFSGTISGSLGGGVTLEVEGSRSVLDVNRLSSLDDVSNAGDAYALRAVFDPGEVTLFDHSIGRIRAELDQRYVDERFSSFGRIDPVEYSRQWDIERSSAATERRRQANVSYAPCSFLTLETYAGSLSRSDGIRAERVRAGLHLADSGSIDLRGSVEQVRRDDDRLNLSAFWNRYQASAAGTIAFLRPTLLVNAEHREEHADTTGIIQQGSFRSADVTPGLEAQVSQHWILNAQAAWRTVDSALAGSLVSAFTSIGAGAGASLHGLRNFSLSVDVQTRATDFTDPFRVRGNADTRTTLARTQATARLFDRAVETRGLYEFSSQQSARLERVFIRVASGTGQYAYGGDANGNGIADEEEYIPVRYDGDYAVILVPGEALVPVNAVKASIRVRVGLRELGVGGPLSRISTETSLRVDERSTLPGAGSIALLNLSRFLDPATTISGQQLLTNDVHYGEADPDLSIRLRVTESRGLTQLVNAPVSSYGNERSVRVRGRLSVDINDEAEVYVKRDRSLGDVLSARNRDLVVTGGQNDLLYRLDRVWELGLMLGFQRSENVADGQEGTADLNEQAVRLTMGIPSRGSMRAELRREEITLTGFAASVAVPYEMTGGRPVGRSWLVELRGDLRLTDVIQLTASYLGRLEPGSRIVHTARAEAKAVF